MQLDIILRGQSNAALLAEHDGWAGAGRLVNRVERLLGFDGVADRVELVYARDAGEGGTAYPATAFLEEWIVPSAEGGEWRVGERQEGLLRHLGDRVAEGGRGDASAVVWLHSEYDSRDAGLSAAEWAEAVRQDAALVAACWASTRPTCSSARIPTATAATPATRRSARAWRRWPPTPPSTPRSAPAPSTSTPTTTTSTGTGGPRTTAARASRSPTRC